MRAPSFQLPPVRMLVAETDAALLGSIRYYAEGTLSGGVKLCATASTGSEVLEALRHGLEPDVLVLDSMLHSVDILTLLDRLKNMSFAKRPLVIVTACSCSEQMHERLLTLGVDFFILKPYRLQELFHTVEMLGGGEAELRQRHVDNLIATHLSNMRINYSMCGAKYLMRAVQVLACTEGTRLLGETYAQISLEEKVSAGAVATAVRRSIAQMQRAGTTEYLQMCRYYSYGAEKVLPSADFLELLAQTVRQEMNL